jgi:hypothetical protein
MSRPGILILLCLAAPSVFGQAILEYKLSKGDVFTIRQEAVQEITQEMDGTTYEITNSIDGTLEFRVTGLKGTTYEIAVTFKELSLYMASNTDGVMLDIKAGQAPVEDMQSRIFNSLLNVPIHIRIDRSGDVLEVAGGDSLITRMASASGIKDELTLNIIKESLKRDFGSEALSNSYEQMTYIYPKNKIHIGDSWQNEYKGKISSRNQWTLEGMKAGKASIHGNASVEMDLLEESASMQLSGERKTEISADLVSGFLLAMKVESQSRGFSSLPQLGRDEIPTTIKSTITYKRI